MSGCFSFKVYAKIIGEILVKKFFCFSFPLIDITPHTLFVFPPILYSLFFSLLCRLLGMAPITWGGWRRWQVILTTHLVGHSMTSRRSHHTRSYRGIKPAHQQISATFLTVSVQHLLQLPKVIPAHEISAMRPALSLSTQRAASKVKPSQEIRINSQRTRPL